MERGDFHVQVTSSEPFPLESLSGGRPVWPGHLWDYEPRTRRHPESHGAPCEPAAAHGRELLWQGHFSGSPHKGSHCVGAQQDPYVQIRCGAHTLKSETFWKTPLGLFLKSSRRREAEP